MAKIMAFIVPTTHWDREWVMTLGQYQVRLGHMLDKVLALTEKYPEYRFMMDGQSIALGDYLAIRPENRERLILALERGALAAGPWYVLGIRSWKAMKARFGISTTAWRACKSLADSR